MNIKQILKEELKKIKENDQVSEKQKVELIELYHYYAQYKDISDFNIPQIQDRKLVWLYQQIFLLIDELKINNIDTDDFLNTNNWGYKSTGNLGMFDVGFGNYFNQFDVEPDEINLNEDDLLNKIKSQLKIGASDYMGSGLFGHAHDIGNNRVLKITKDKTEAMNSQKIIGKNLNHVANIYDVKRFSRDNQEYYTIVLEKLKLDTALETTYQQLDELFDAHRNMHLDPSILSQIKDEKIKGFLTDMISLGYKETWEKWMEQIRGDNEYDFNDISNIPEWIKGSVTNNHDIDEEVPDYIKILIKKLTN